MLRLTSIINKTDVDAIDMFLLENQIQECVITHDVDLEKYSLCGYYNDRHVGESVFTEIKKIFDDIGKIEVDDIADADWVNEYKKHCEPWSYEDLFWIPLWVKDSTNLPNENAIPVYIDTGLAFGTGMHETTRLCAKALTMFRDMYIEDASWCVKKCIDVGCGTGILGISALKMGIQRVVFIDSDKNAIYATKENMAHNSMALDLAEYICSDLKFGLLGRNADIVFANILSDVLIKNADILASSVRPGGMLCLSGILVDEMPEVRKVFQKSFKKNWTAHFENSAKYGKWGMLEFIRG